MFFSLFQSGQGEGLGMKKRRNIVNLSDEERENLLAEQKKTNKYHKFVEGNLIIKQGRDDDTKEEVIETNTTNTDKDADFLVQQALPEEHTTDTKKKDDTDEIASKSDAVGLVQGHHDKAAKAGRWARFARWCRKRLNK